MLDQLFEKNGQVYKISKVEGNFVFAVKQIDGKGVKGRPSKFNLVEVQALLNPSDLPFTTDEIQGTPPNLTFAGVENPQEIETAVNGEVLTVVLDS